ncbi:MAG: ROK family transcriptional regulator [Propionibacteriaceae bacterium]|jgi:predicted NBD/HSP70 family sugar kinase|nr:ROK family transcriptional regulator [Propionibacteriaceae bacterium]
MYEDVPGTLSAPIAVGRGAQHATNIEHVIQALAFHGPCSQATVSRTVGLSRPSVHSIIHELEAAGKVEILPGPNRRDCAVRLVANTGRYIALDLGHELVRGMFVDLERKVSYRLAESITGSHHHTGDLAAIGKVVDGLCALSGVSLGDMTSIAVTLHAPIDWAGIVSPSTIMPNWTGLVPTEVISSYLGKDVVVENDANAAAIAEWAWGAGRGSKCFMYVKTSQGVGAGIVMSGSVMRGATGVAGEIGHIVVEPHGPLCNCGNRGCLSAVASGQALLAQFDRINDAPESLHDLVDQALADNPVASRVITEAGHHLGTVLAHVIAILGPDRVAIGGELARAGKLHLDAVKSTVIERIVHTISTGTILVHGSIDDSPSLMGGLLLAMRADGQAMSVIPDWILQQS